jgi:hypothetical protein
MWIFQVSKHNMTRSLNNQELACVLCIRRTSSFINFTSTAPSVPLGSLTQNLYVRSTNLLFQLLQKPRNTLLHRPGPRFNSRPLLRRLPLRIMLQIRFALRGSVHLLMNRVIVHQRFCPTQPSVILRVIKLGESTRWSSWGVDPR